MTCEIINTFKNTLIILKFKSAVSEIKLLVEEFEKIGSAYQSYVILITTSSTEKRVRNYSEFTWDGLAKKTGP